MNSNSSSSSISYRISEYEAICANCLTANNNSLFFCKSCSSERLISYNQLEKLKIAHIDCDAFFANVEKMLQPSLRDKPIIISSNIDSVVSTACYIARRYGIHSAMPTRQALKLCPDVVMVPPHMEKYREISEQIKNILLDISPAIEPASIDEFYIDLKGTERLYNELPYTIMRETAQRINHELKITVSVGLSYNKFLAKFASDLKKPNGFSIISQLEAQSLIAPFSVSKIQGVGEALRENFAKNHIYLIADLQVADKDEIMRKYGKPGLHAYYFALAIDKSVVKPSRVVKSISREKSFFKNIKDFDELLKELFNLTEELSYNMKKKNLFGSTLCLKLRLKNKKNKSRTITLSQPSNLQTEIYSAAEALLRQESSWINQSGEGVRLIGISLSNLCHEDEAIRFETLEDNVSKKVIVEKVADKLKNKFGENALKIAKYNIKNN